jgi:O-antigen/teichoic acid export membrane protein
MGRSNDMAVSTTPVAAPSLARGRAVLQNFVPSVSSGLIGKVLGLAATLFVARRVATSTFGIAAIALAVVSYIDASFIRGLETQAVRELSPWPAEPRWLVRRFVFLRLGSASTVALLVAAGAATMLHGEARLAGVVASTLLVVRGMQTRWFYQAQQRLGYVSIGTVISQVAALVLIIVLVDAASPASLIVGVTIGAELLLVLWLMPPILRVLIRGSLMPTRTRVKAFAGYRLGLGFVLIQGIATADLLLIGALRSAHDAGLYSAAYRVTDGVFIVSSSLGLTFLPRIAAAARTGKLPTIVSAYWRLTVLFAVPLALIGPAVASATIALLFGTRYAPAATPLALLLIGAGVSFADTVFLYTLAMLQRDRLFLAIVLAGFLTNLLLNLALIPRFGISAAAAVTLLTYTVMLVSVVWVQRDLAASVRPLRALPMPLLVAVPGAGTVAVLERLDIAPSVTVAAAAVAFLVLLVLQRRELALVIRRADDHS